MIKAEELINIGRLLKPHGIKGEINAEILDDFIDFTLIEYVVVEIDGIFVPFFIDDWREKTSTIILLHFENVNTEQQAKTFTGKEIFVKKENFCSLQPDEDGVYLSDLIGYTLIDTDNSLVGEIIDFDDSTANLLFTIRSKDGEICLIPASQELIKDVDVERRRVKVDVPDGIIDINKLN